MINISAPPLLLPGPYNALCCVHSPPPPHGAVLLVSRGQTGKNQKLALTQLSLQEPKSGGWPRKI